MSEPDQLLRRIGDAVQERFESQKRVLSFSEYLSLVRAHPWRTLATDAAGDGQRAEQGDGKSFAFHHDVEGDTLWFRWELHGGFDALTPAVSVSFDVDADQSNGLEWYGTNERFRFERVASVGPLETVSEGVRGYNGITDSAGVRTQSWMNQQSGGLVFYADPVGESYYLGIARSDVSPEMNRFHVIGSVGRNARWNDDIGEDGFAAITLDSHGDTVP